MSEFKEALEDRPIGAMLTEGLVYEWYKLHFATITRALEIAEVVGPLIEARKYATQGKWHKVGLPWNNHTPYIIAGHHDPHVGKAILDVMEVDGYEGEDKDDIERQYQQDQIEYETNCDFVCLAANTFQNLAEENQ